ncbi:MAG: response regulator transcription factor, partial [Actinomycetota bacterium]
MSVPGAGAARPRVVIVDDHGLFRSGVRSELGGDVEVVGEAAEVAQALELIGQVLPDVVLLDVHMPSGGGQAVVAAVRVAHPEVRFLALSASDAPEDVIAVIRAGARGYVTKTISGAELVDAIRRIAAGDSVFSPRLAGFVLDAFAAQAPAGAASGPGSELPPADPELEQLTPREREVLRLIARGYTYKEIAGELFISIKTVETHVSSVLRKLQLSTR